jgi:hypothetical protein
VRVAIPARNENPDVVSAPNLRFGEQFDVIFNSADDGKIIFIDVEDFHFM